MMRAGYLMHRYVHRLLGDRRPVVSYSTDGAEMGKLMVAEGLGATILPDFSVLGDPLVHHGAIVWRPIADDGTEIDLAIRRRRSDVHPRAAGDLYRLFVAQAATQSAAAAA
jgi:DNA-binding transcriptional LysR family regulator